MVALGVVTEGMLQTSNDIIQAGNADFMVAQNGASDFSFSTVQQRELDRIAARPHVPRAIGVLSNITGIGGNLRVLGDFDVTVVPAHEELVIAAEAESVLTS